MLGYDLQLISMPTLCIPKSAKRVYIGYRWGIDRV